MTVHRQLQYLVHPGAFCRPHPLGHRALGPLPHRLLGLVTAVQSHVNHKSVHLLPLGSEKSGELGDEGGGGRPAGRAHRHAGQRQLEEVGRAVGANLDRSRGQLYR